MNGGFLSFVFVLSKKKATNLNFYYYYFNRNDNKIELKKESPFNNIMVKNNKINCQINSYLSNINCFSYYTNDNKEYLISTIFSVDEDNIDIKNKETYNYTLDDEVNDIKSVLSFNNKFFICSSSGNISRLICYINDYFPTNQFEKMNCRFGSGFNTNYKIFYFNETGHFIVTSRGSLETGMLDSYTNKIKACYNFTMFPKQNSKVDDYSIILNKTLNKYQLLNYSDFTNSEICEDKSNLISQDDEQIIISSLPAKIAYTTKKFSLQTYQKQSDSHKMELNIIII